MLNNSLSISQEAMPKISESRRIVRILLSRKLVIFSIITLAVFVILAIFAPLIAPYNPYHQNLSQALQQPNSEHLLGTDALGRDTLSRVIYGARSSLVIGFVSVMIAALVGMALGLLAGYFGSWTYTIIMRFIDSLMAFPMILLALTITALLGGGLTNIILAISIALTSIYARLMCGQVLSVKNNDYVVAERSLGASNLRIMLLHVLPNCFAPLIVLITLQLGTAILAATGLSFLGVGIHPPTADWGSMIADGYEYLLKLPVLSFAPGIAIMLVVFSFNLMGDGLRDALDPRLRGTI